MYVHFVRKMSAKRGRVGKTFLKAVVPAVGDKVNT